MHCVNRLQRLLVQNLNWNKAGIACLAQILQALICTRTVNLRIKKFKIFSLNFPLISQLSFLL